jgi:two-component sensor histidine kinase
MRQGESIQFYAKLEERHAGDIGAWTRFSNITLYAYTNESHIVKFKYPEEEGYKTLAISTDGKTLSGTIPSDDTKTMLGALIAEIMVELDGKKEIGKRNTGLVIREDQIKHEI